MDGESLLLRYITLSGLSGQRIWETGGRAAAVKLIPQPAHRMDKGGRSLVSRSADISIRWSHVSRGRKEQEERHGPGSTIHPIANAASLRRPLWEISLLFRASDPRDRRQDARESGVTFAGERDSSRNF